MTPSQESLFGTAGESLEAALCTSGLWGAGDETRWKDIEEQLLMSWLQSCGGRPRSISSKEPSCEMGIKHYPEFTVPDG